ncbi:MAG TPA: carboxypeptidase-like regulatory domain-containing protein [Candidatus Acidoferrum sp.]|nr:carboxypeptidase-like regulatory domain-containing protein [Candidatus Acidoferrum sp.]
MRNLRRVLIASLVATVALLFAAQSGWGQNVYGTIAGNVSDSSGAAVANATVTLTNLGTSESHKMESDASGNYTFVNILPGRYKVEAEKSGFKKFVRQPIIVEIESGLKVDITLQVGAQTETVEVSAEAPLLQPETNSLGQVVEQRSVTELPLNGRNPLALVALVPGVVPQGQPSAGNSSTGNPVGANPFALGDFQVGGGMPGQSQILIDGTPTNGAYLNVVTVIPTQDAIEEFKVQTNNLGPEYGRFAGGVINLNTKGGTNSYHGSLYEFIRNKVLNANDFFANEGGTARPPFTQNQFGGNAGGPILKDKLFFFGSYEGFRQRKGNILSTWVPTAAERTGDFSTPGSSNTKDPATGQLTVLPIYDPYTSIATGPGACNTAAPNTPQTCRQQLSFNGKLNVIDPARLDQTAVALLSYFPMPNQTNNPNGNFVESYSTGGDTDQYNGRIDYNLSQKQRIYGRYTHNHILSLPDEPFKDICSDRCTEDTKAHQISLGDTYALSPKTILDVHIGYTRYVYLRTPLSQGIDLSAFGPNWKALTSQMTYTHIPTVCVSQTNGDSHWGNGSWCSQGTGSGIGAWDDTLSINPMVSHIMGKHNLKAGFEFRLLRNNYYQSNDPAGFFNFDARSTAANPLNSGNAAPGANGPSCAVPGSAACASGNGLASFLLGLDRDNGDSVTEPARTADQNLYKAFYVGDTYQLTKKITVNLGLRVDMQGDWTERFNRIVVFNPTETSPIGAAAGLPNLKGAYDLVASSQHSSRTAFDAWNNVSPRLGVSYQFDKNTVIRAGYGMFYLPVDGRWDDAPHNLFINSFNTNLLAVNSDQVTPKFTLSNPFPGGGITPPFGRDQARINQQGNGLGAATSDFKAPYVQQWNLDIQRQFTGNLLFDVAYAGAKGTRLPMHSQSINQLPPNLLPKTAQDVTNLTTPVINPFAGNCPPPNVLNCTGPVKSGGVGTSFKVPAAQLLLPFPQWDDVALEEPNNRDSIYHSMQMKVQKRFTAGAQVLASYTVAKLIDNTNSEINWLEASPVSWNDGNPNDLRHERSLDAFDVSQRLVLGSILDLPVGKGKRFGGNLDGVANKLASGWGINTIITFQTGFPIIIGGCPGALDSQGIPNVPCARPTRTALSHLTSGSLANRLNQWFDTSVFTKGDPADLSVRGPQTDSRTEPNIRSDGVKNFDFALFKNTKFGPDEKFGTEFRAEFFNGFNHPQFNPPNSGCCGGSDFGRVTAQYNLPRLIQFALRFSF